MKRHLAVFALLSALLLTGCRVRPVSDPGQADIVLPTEEVPQDEPSIPPSPSPDPTPDPSPTPEATPPPEQTPSPTADPEPVQTEAAELSRPDQISSLDSAGAALLQERPTEGVTVTYDSNGGDSAPVSSAVQTGQPYGAQPVVTRRGYAFSGWWTSAAGGSQVFADTVVTETTPHTLYAHWAEKGTSTVTFDGNGGRVKSRQARLELSGGDRYGEMPTPLREGYRFLGWFTGREEGEPVAGTDVFSGEDQTLYAHWEYDPYEFWAFTLRNRTQQVYLCQQVPIYYETPAEGTTAKTCGLISDTGSRNIAENRDDPIVTDDWVRSKKPAVVLKVSDTLSASVRQSVAERFPDQRVVLVSSAALGSGPSGLYARLALAKQLYGDWYTDVDLSVVAQELGVSEIPILF